MATKYQETFKQMLEQNKALFDEFGELHDRYALDSSGLQDQFNTLGGQVQNVIRQYEDRLCGRSEGSGYGAYSGNLAEKFQTEVRKHFPKIDYVGIKVKPADPAFSLKKISL